jgi:hypothetical protein
MSLGGPERMILAAVFEAYAPEDQDEADRQVYDFAEGEPSVYDLLECLFRPEDRPQLEAALARADGERARLLELLLGSIPTSEEEITDEHA